MLNATTSQSLGSVGEVGKRLSHLLGIGNILSWNVRGLNVPNKHKEIKLLCNEENVGLIGLLEIKFEKIK